MGNGCKKWLHKELNHFHPITFLDGKLLDEKGAPGAAWKCRSFLCTGCVRATFADCVVGGGEPTRGGAGHRCVALAPLTRSNCRKAFSLPFFLSFNLQSEDCSPKQFFFFQRPFWELPSRASGGSISGTSFARNFFSSDRLSQVLFFLSFFSIFLLVLCSFLCRGEGIFVDGVKVCLSLDCVKGGFRFCS